MHMYIFTCSTGETFQFYLFCISMTFSQLNPMFTLEQRKQRIERLKQLCPVSGECVLFGRGEEEFQQWFQDIRKAGITSIRPIGGESNNGFVRELKRSVDGYDSYVVLKSNLERTSDNLYYEWYVGQYLNTFMNRFPLFVKTYGVYEYDNEVDKAIMQKNSDLDVLPNLKETTMQRSIEEPENICIVVQQVHQAISFKSLLDQFTLTPTEELKHEILCVLYQVFFVLPLIPGFSHNDLHYENVILTPANGKYYQYEYTKGHTFIFQCMYAAKIIDYGRCIYPGTTWLKGELDDFSTEKEQTDAGYPWKEVDINPCSALDYRLIHYCMGLGVLPATFFDSIRKIKDPAFRGSICGTTVNTYIRDLRIPFTRFGVPDMYEVANQLEALIQPHTYALPRACTIHVSDVGPMRVDWPQAAGTRRRKRKARKSIRLWYGSKR